MMWPLPTYCPHLCLFPTQFLSQECRLTCSRCCHVSLPVLERYPLPHLACWTAHASLQFSLQLLSLFPSVDTPLFMFRLCLTHLCPSHYCTFFSTRLWEFQDQGLLSHPSTFVPSMFLVLNKRFWYL